MMAFAGAGGRGDLSEGDLAVARQKVFISLRLHACNVATTNSLLRSIPSKPVPDHSLGKLFGSA